MNLELISQLVASTIRLTTPIMLAALCAMLCERAGVLNIGLEGMILIGACMGAVFSHITQNALLGMLFAILFGILTGILFAVLTVWFQANQAVVSVGLNIFASGLTRLLLDVVWGNRGASVWLPAINKFNVPLLAQIPVIGKCFESLSPTVVFTFILVFVLNYLLFKSNWGLRLRSVGESPVAAQTVGLNVYKIRFQALIIGGALCGIAGAYLSIDHLNVFTKDMSAGRGYLAYAANIFGQWNPIGVMLSSLVFGAMEALQMRIQGGEIPPQFAQMIPYIVTVLAVTFRNKKVQGPAAVGVLFEQVRAKHKQRKC